jgi:hypothetical protein
MQKDFVEKMESSKLKMYDVLSPFAQPLLRESLELLSNVGE